MAETAATESDQPFNRVAALIEAIDRIPWATGKLILQQQDLPVRMGWEKTKEALTKIACESSDSEAKVLLLEKFYKDHLLAGDKASRFFVVSIRQGEKLRELLEDTRPPDSCFSYCYPYPVSEDELKAITGEPKLMEIVRRSSGIGAIYSSSCSFQERKELAPADFGSEEDRKIDLSAYDEIIAVRKRYRQSFDFIFLHKYQHSGDKQILELRVDRADELTADGIKFSFSQLQDRVESLLSEACDEVTKLPLPIRLFSAIDKLYADKNEGKVCELSFTTDSDFVKHNKGRRGNSDLRNEAFQRGGESAVDHIAPFRIAVRWKLKSKLGDNSKVSLSPELFLPGKWTMLSKPSLALDYAVVRGCVQNSNYNFVCKKLFTKIDISD